MHITIETLVHRGTAKYSAVEFIQQVGTQYNIIIPELNHLNKNMKLRLQAQQPHVLYIIQTGNCIVLLYVVIGYHFCARVCVNTPL